MKFCNIAVVFTALFLPVLVNASQINLKPGIELLVLNGMERSDFNDGFVLSEGANQAVIRMSKSFGNGGSKDTFSSSPYIVSFMSQGKEITIDHPKIYSVQHAKNVFNKNPQWLVYEDGDLIDSETVFLEGKGGFVPYWDVKALVRDYNEKNGITFAAVSASTVAVAEVKSATKSKAVTPEKVDASQALSQLQAWYLKASKEERKAFRKWMIDQE